MEYQNADFFDLKIELEKFNKGKRLKIRAIDKRRRMERKGKVHQSDRGIHHVQVEEIQNP